MAEMNEVDEHSKLALKITEVIKAAQTAQMPDGELWMRGMCALEIVVASMLQAQTHRPFHETLWSFADRVRMEHARQMAAVAQALSSPEGSA